MTAGTRPPGEIWMVLKDRKMLGRLIALQDWSIRGLATASGFQSHSYLNRLVLGKVTTCSAERAVAICANLQVPLDSLFLTKMSSDPEQPSGRPFRSGTASGGRTSGARAANRGSRRATGRDVAAVKAAGGATFAVTASVTFLLLLVFLVGVTGLGAS